MAWWKGLLVPDRAKLSFFFAFEVALLLWLPWPAALAAVLRTRTSGGNNYGLGGAHRPSGPCRYEGGTLGMIHQQQVKTVAVRSTSIINKLAPAGLEAPPPWWRTHVSNIQRPIRYLYQSCRSIGGEGCACLVESWRLLSLSAPKALLPSSAPTTRCNTLTATRCCSIRRDAHAHIVIKSAHDSIDMS